MGSEDEEEVGEIKKQGEKRGDRGGKGRGQKGWRKREGDDEDYEVGSKDGEEKEDETTVERRRKRRKMSESGR